MKFKLSTVSVEHELVVAKKEETSNNYIYMEKLHEIDSLVSSLIVVE